ncbi:sugar 3,4-ketoisomerase [Rheinheimera sp. NSM]|uniref:sugar 3,4-ketoisomerase n=1 Tax=Rheinheimera sp. NSM TaxID=3457884 RepID=UPI004035A807
MSLINLIELPVLGDARGSLVSIEANNTVPFDIKRAYYIFNTKDNVARGFHAHKNLKQLAVCVSGQCRFELDNGLQRESVLLDSPAKGLFIVDMVWREMHDFSKDCVLIVFASEHYDEADYIRDYEDFLEQVKS